MQKHNEMLFFKEASLLKREVERQADSPWISIRGVSIPRPGHIFRVKDGAKYRFTPAGSLVLVLEVVINKLFLENPREQTVKVTPLNLLGQLNDMSTFDIFSKDLEHIGLESEIQIQEGCGKEEKGEEDLCFVDGDAVELSHDVPLLSEHPLYGASGAVLPKGLKGIIDEVQFQHGATLDEINARKGIWKKDVQPCTWFEHQPRRITFIKLPTSPLEIRGKKIPIPFASHGIRYDIYFPHFRSHLKIASSHLQRRSFDPSMFSQVVMSEEMRARILSFIRADEDRLKAWGLSAFQKGKGLIFFAYGPPGTGKTMTGEALAEYLGRPIYFASAADFGYSIDSFEKGLNAIIEKTQRWNSVTVVDEAEVILRSRDAGFFESTARVASVLRNLEKLERGILWLTTNRPFDVDVAIDSRILAHFHFPPFDKEKRLKVWKNLLPANMPIVWEKDGMFEELAEIQLNGREIRNAIVAAARRASSEALEEVPSRYLFEAARIIDRNSQELNKAKREERPESSIGFGRQR